MRLSETGELVLLKAIRERFKEKPGAVITGIGDDAAVVKLPSLTGTSTGLKLLLTTDMMAEGVHFDLKFITPFQLGFKLISVNVSDIYAMGGRPRFALLALAMPGTTDAKFFNRFFDGVKRALALYRVTLIGGDLSGASGGGMALSATLIGYAKKPIGRAGARPGEKVYVTGGLGESACGLELLKKIRKRVDFTKPVNKPLGWPLGWEIMEPLLRRHLMPEARKPYPQATAMIDLSDGLFIDLTRLCDESGVGVKLIKEKIPISDAVREAASYLGIDPFELAVSGGEDYELLFTAPPAKRPRRPRAVLIGEITASGRYLIDEQGRKSRIIPKGYRHFGGEI